MMNSTGPTLLDRHGERILLSVCEADKYTLGPIQWTRMILPDSLESLQRFVEKLTWYFWSGFVECVRGNYEGHHNVILFTHEVGGKSTERPDVSCWIVCGHGLLHGDEWPFLPQAGLGKTKRKWEMLVNDIDMDAYHDAFSIDGKFPPLVIHITWFLSLFYMACRELVLNNTYTRSMQVAAPDVHRVHHVSKIDDQPLAIWLLFLVFVYLPGGSYCVWFDELRSTE